MRGNWFYLDLDKAGGMDCHASLAMTAGIAMTAGFVMTAGIVIARSDRFVIARSVATWQSTKSEFMDCRAWLAMTVRYLHHQLNFLIRGTQSATPWAMAA